MLAQLKKKLKSPRQGDFIVLGRSGASATATSGWVIRVNKPTAPGFPCSYTKLLSGIAPWAGERDHFNLFFFRFCSFPFPLRRSSRRRSSRMPSPFFPTVKKKQASARRPSPTSCTALAMAQSSPSSCSPTAPPASSRSWLSRASRAPETSRLRPETWSTPCRGPGRTPTRFLSTGASTRPRSRPPSRRRAR